MERTIIFDISSANWAGRTGIGRVTESLLRGSAEIMERGEWNAGKLVCVSCWPHRFDSALRKRLEGLGVEFPVLAFRSMYLFRFFLLPRYARRRGASLVVLPEPVYSLLPGATPFAVIVNDFLYRDDPRSVPRHVRLLYRAMAERMLRRARRIGSISRFTAERAHAIVPETRGRIDVLPTVSDLIDKTRGKPLLEQESLPERFALFVGALIPRKNIRGLIRAFAEWKRRHPEEFIPLVVVGKPNTSVDDIEGFVRKHAIAGVIIPRRNITDEALAWLYRNAEFLAFPSYYEGFGLPVQEAMQFGCPVLTSEGTATAEAAGDAALLVDPTDASAMIEAIRRLARDAKLWGELRERGFRRTADLTPRLVGESFHRFLLAALDE